MNEWGHNWVLQLTCHWKRDVSIHWHEVQQKCGCTHVFGMCGFFFSHSCMLNLAPSVSKCSLKRNYSELWKEWCVSSEHANWLIVVCHSNLCDTLVVTETKDCLAVLKKLTLCACLMTGSTWPNIAVGSWPCSLTLALLTCMQSSWARSGRTQQTVVQPAHQNQQVLESTSCRCQHIRCVSFSCSTTGTSGRMRWVLLCFCWLLCFGSC